jgi:hypothetical protein
MDVPYVQVTVQLPHAAACTGCPHCLARTFLKLLKTTRLALYTFFNNTIKHAPTTYTTAWQQDKTAGQCR